MNIVDIQSVKMERITPNKMMETNSTKVDKNEFKVYWIINNTR